jgi:hypothetical protein
MTTQSQSTGQRLSSPVSHDLAPEYDALDPLFGGFAGPPIVISNNPESLSRQGLLCATEPMTPSQGGTYSRTLVVKGSTALTKASFYMHHIVKGTLGATQFVLLAKPHGNHPSVKINAWGAAVTLGSTWAMGQTPSFRVQQAVATGRLWQRNERAVMVNLRGAEAKANAPLAIFSLPANQAFSADARVHIVSEDDVPFQLRCVAAPGGSDAAEAWAFSSRQYAYGNIQCPCCRGVISRNGQEMRPEQGVFGGYGWGTPCGVYENDRWVGGLTVDITAASSTRGWKFLAAPTNRYTEPSGQRTVRRENGRVVVTGAPFGTCAPGSSEPAGTGANQRPAAIAFYEKSPNVDPNSRHSENPYPCEGRDSDPFSTSCYGGEFELDWRVRNSAPSCISVRLLFASYVSGKHPTKSNVGADKRAWDGMMSVSLKDPTSTEWTLANGQHTYVLTRGGELVHQLISFRLEKGQSKDIKVRTFVPGLIVLPHGFILKTEPCARNQ